MISISKLAGRHPWITVMVVTAAALGGLFFLSRWQSDQRWQRYCEQARQRGVKLTLAEFEQPEVEDSDNFAAIPVLRAAFTGKRPFELTPGSEAPKFGNAVKGEPVDWLGWQKCFKAAGFISEISAEPARDVLKALEHFAEQSKEWQAGLQRPYCRFPLDYSAGPAMSLTHMSTFQDATRLFTFRMRAHLVLGDSPAAYEDFSLAIQSYRALLTHPTLIGGLVRLSMLGIVHSALGQGLAQGGWAEPELRKIQAELAELPLADDYRLAIGSERGFTNSMLDPVALASPLKRGKLLAPLLNFNFPPSSPSALSLMAFSLIPRKVIRDNQLRQNCFFDELLAAIAPDKSRIDPAAPSPSSPDKITGTLEMYYFALHRVSAPVFLSISERYMRTFANRNQAVLACALERFRMVHGAFPETLAELVPEFCAKIPIDPYTGAAMHFRRNPAGSFVLYSDGANRVDDGGVLNPAESERNQSDIIWLYTPNPPARTK